MRAYGYDNDGLLTGAGDESITRDPSDGLITASTLGGVTTAMTYDGFGEPLTDTVTDGATNLYSVGYTRDNLGRIRQKIETVNGVIVTWVYGYDGDGRLNAVTENGNPVASYGYDQNGNRVSVNAAIIASYDNQDRLLTFGSNSYSYNANGELLTKANSAGATSYSWDALGNLLGVQLPSGQDISYIYDGQNRLVGKEVNGTLTEGFLCDGQLEPVAELDGSGNIVEQFVYGTRPNVPDYIIKGGVEYKVIADQVGSPILIVNATTGAVAEQISYDAWGNITSDSNPGFQPFGFAGGIYDADTGLVHFGARDYDPQTGRWISRDPIMFAGGETSLYGYAGNDPLNFVDPSGLLRIPFTHIWVPAGEQYGAESAQHWADQFVKDSGPKAWFDYGMGLFASLWTPCTSTSTAEILGPFAAGSAIRGAAAVGRAAANNVTPLARAWFLANSLFNVQPSATTAAVELAPTIEAVTKIQGLNEAEQGLMLETEGQALNPTEIVEPPNKP